MDHELVEVLLPVSVLGSIGLGIVSFTKVLTNYFLRKKMVEKGLSGADAVELLSQQNESKFSALKWGLIILFGGIGLILLEILPYDESSPLPYGVIAAFISLGFLIYYFLVKKELKD